MTPTLAHLTVIDATGPLGANAGTMLAALGARVIKVAADAPQPEAHPVWDAVKQPCPARPGTPEFDALLDTADIVLRNPGGEADGWIEGRPALIDVVVGPFMPDGALAERPASDLTLSARSGLTNMIGDPDRAPLRMPGAQVYALAGIQAATAALAALAMRGRTGKGQRVLVSALQSGVHANYRDPLVWAWTGRIGKRTGNLLVRGKSGVSQLWRCADGFVTWSLVDNPPMMRAMVKLMGEDAGELAGVEWNGLLVADLPPEQIARWEAVVAAFFLRHKRADLAEWSSRDGLGLSYIDLPGDVLASDHLAARGLWAEAGGVKVPRRLWVSSLDEGMTA